MAGEDDAALEDEAVLDPIDPGQWECGLPVPHMPQERGLPEQVGASCAAPFVEANTESFFSSFTDPQRGHFVPSHALERTRISLSRSQPVQWNS